MHTIKQIFVAVATVALLSLTTSTISIAYDGTKCKAKGNCWEAKPGYPAKVKGSKYDPKHSSKELNKQSVSITGMEKRNAMRVKCFQKTGKFEYDVDKLSC